jgi:predicted amidohydrolase
MTAQPMRVAVWQYRDQATTPAERLHLLRDLFAGGALAGIDLLILPELWTSGYFDAAAVIAASEAVNGPSVMALADMARRHGLAIAFGFPELDGEHRYNTVALLDADGALQLRYRKVNLWGDYERALFAAGDAPSAIATVMGWRIGFSICYDTEFAETTRDLALRGADLVIAPTACGSEFPLVAEAIIRVRAAENGVWLAFANRSGQEHGYRFDGKSAIIGPNGVPAACAQDVDALITAVIDQAAIARVRQSNPFLTELRWAPPRLGG